MAKGTWNIEKNVINQAILTVLVKETETKYPIEPGKIDIF